MKFHLSSIFLLFVLQGNDANAFIKTLDDYEDRTNRGSMRLRTRGSSSSPRLGSFLNADRSTNSLGYFKPPSQNFGQTSFPLLFGGDGDDGPSGSSLFLPGSLGGDRRSERALRRLVRCIGGMQAIQQLDQFFINAVGQIFTEFEGERTDVIIPASNYTRTYTFDISGDRYRADDVVNPFFELLSQIPQVNVTRIINGDLGIIQGGFALIQPGSLISDGVASFKRQQMFFNPHLLLQQVLNNTDLLLSSSRFGKSIRIADPISDIFLFVDPWTGLISRLTTTESHPLLGDVPISVVYSDWSLQTRSGLRFPRNVQLLNRNGEILWNEIRSGVADAPISDTSILQIPSPQQGSNPLPPADPNGLLYGQQAHHFQETFFALGLVLPHNVGYSDSITLAPGVFVLPSYANSMVIVHNTGVLLIEGTVSDVQANLLMTEAERLAPGQPITHLLQSHYHVDHAGGVRQIIRSTGATLVVGYGNGDFWRAALEAPSTIRPLGGNESYSFIEIGMMRQMVIIDDGNFLVTVYHTTMSGHANDFLLMTVDTGGMRFLYEADLYTAGGGGSISEGGPERLFDLMRELDFINDDCTSDIPLVIVPAHGIPQSLEDSVVELAGLGTDVGCPL